jgi:DUF218 domain
LILTLIAAGALLSSDYWLYTTTAHRSDAIVVLLGADDDAKIEWAFKLLDSGCARYLLIPGKSFSCDNKKDKCLRAKHYRFNLQNYNFDNLTTIPAWEEKLPWYKERTHIELIMTRQMMAAQDLESGIIVSHPYHMRRIRIIAATVFDNTSFRLDYLPTEDDPMPDQFLRLYVSRLLWVFSEAIKIVWFKFYAYFLA